MLAQDADNDILLVHGVFGSGKTTFLSILITYVVTLFERHGSGPVRFFVCVINFSLTHPFFF